MQKVTGTSDDSIAQQVIARDPQVAANLRLELAKIAAEREQAAQQAQLDMLKTVVASDQTQADVNKTEAQNANLFVAGWRPFVGWVCGAGLLWQFIAAPILGFSFQRAMPSVDTSTLLLLLQGMLGLGALRTYEKVRGVTQGHG